MEHKLLLLYAENKKYFDDAEKYIVNSSHGNQDLLADEDLTRSDVDRLLAHISMLEKMLRVLHETYLHHEIGGQSVALAAENKNHANVNL